MFTHSFKKCDLSWTDSVNMANLLNKEFKKN